MTTWWAWALRRARASAVLLAKLFALVTAPTGILAFALGNAGALATSAARNAISSADPAEAGVRAQTRLGPEAEAQDTLARERLTEGFAPAPITIWTTFVSEPRPAATADGALSERLILWAGGHLGPDVAEVEGDWPQSPGEAALHSEAAARLGIEPGSTLTVDDHELTVTALWRPQDLTAPEWFDEPLATHGVDGVHLGPLVVDRSVLTGGQPFVRWGVVPDTQRITPEQLGNLADGAERAKALVEDADVTGRGITTEGDLDATAIRAAHELAVAEAFGFVPVSLLLLVAVVGLVQVARLLAATRERELHLLFARGSSPRQVVAVGAAEALVVAALGTTVGTGLAAVAVRLVAGSWRHTPTVVTGGLISLGIAVLCLVGVAVHAIVQAARGGQPRSDRVKAVAGAAALVLVGAAAALATWQLRRSGTFIRDDGGAPTTDLLPALAPGLLLAATAIVGLAVLAPVTRLLELVAHGTRSTAAWLAGAQLARGLVVQAVPVVLTILATGTATFASLYAGTGAALARDVAALGQGAPLRAALGPTQARGLEFPTLEGVPGVAASAPVWIDPTARIGDRPLTALAAPMATFGSVASLPGEQGLPTDDLLLPAAGDAGGVPLPDGARTLTVDLAGTITFDPWQRGMLELAPAFHRSLASTLPDDFDVEEQVRLSVESELREAARGLRVSTTLLLRDAHSGLSSEVPGPVLDVPPATLTFDDGYEELTIVEPEAEASAEIELPEGSALVLDGVRLTPGSGHSWADRTVTLTLSMGADGAPVLGEGTAGWSSNIAMPVALAQPYLDAEAQVTPSVVMAEAEINTQEGTQTFEDRVHNRPHQPVTTMDTSGEEWTLTVTPRFEEEIVVAPGIGFALPHGDPLNVMAGAPSPEPVVVPVAITPALAEASTLEVGSTFEVTLFERHVPAEVVAITDAIPGLTTPLGLVLDAAAWGASRAAVNDELRPPTELWASLDGDPLAARDAALTRPGVASVLLTEGADDTGPAPAAQAFWIGAASALVLAITGLAAATATQVAHRRPEVAVLRAMGMTPGAQGRSRAWEIGGILSLATLAGIGAGWLVGWLVVDPVTRSSSAQDVAFPTRLTLEPLPWLVLLGFGAAAVTVILFLLARAVRRQALDNEYREEVR